MKTTLGPCLDYDRKSRHQISSSQQQETLCYTRYYSLIIVNWKVSCSGMRSNTCANRRDRYLKCVAVEYSETRNLLSVNFVDFPVFLLQSYPGKTHKFYHQTSENPPCNSTGDVTNDMRLFSSLHKSLDHITKPIRYPNIISQYDVMIYRYKRKENTT